MDLTFLTKINPLDISFGAHRVTDPIVIEWKFEIEAGPDGITKMKVSVPDQELSLVVIDKDAFSDETRQEFMELKNVSVVYDYEGSIDLAMYPSAIDINGSEVEVRFSLNPK